MRKTGLAKYYPKIPKARSSQQGRAMHVSLDG